MRRTVRLLLLSLSLLAFAPAVLAGNAASPQHDCCPDGHPMPGAPEGGSAPTTPATLPACCIAMPAPLPAASATPARPRNLTLPSGSVDPAQCPTLSPADLPCVASEPPALRPVERAGPGTQTLYLLTRRLRL